MHERNTEYESQGTEIDIDVRCRKNLYENKNYTGHLQEMM